MLNHILNGDSLAYSFPATNIEGEVIVVREALIDGDLSGNNLQDFWQSRAKYLGVNEVEYHHRVVKELKKILNAPDDSEFNLWFEYDLFCQANMWFVISIINSLSGTKKVYAVYTSHLDKNSPQFWNGFGPANAEQLHTCYAHRILLSASDLRLGEELWQAYKKGNLEELMYLSNKESFTFPYLQAVVKAQVDRFPKEGTKGRPQRVIQEITTQVSTDFRIVCEEFWKEKAFMGLATAN